MRRLIGVRARTVFDLFAYIVDRQNHQTARYREADLVVGVEKDTTMRDRPHSTTNEADRIMVQQELVRVFNRDDLDLGDLAAAIRTLLDADKADVPDLPVAASCALLSGAKRASHVMGSGAATP